MSNEPIDEDDGSFEAAEDVLDVDDQNGFDFEESSFAGPHFMASAMDDPEVIELDDEVEGHDDDEASMLNPADMLETSYDEKNTVTCNFCQIVLPRMQDYYEHSNRDHFDQVSTAWYGCNLCVRYYPTRRALKNHREKFHRKKAAAAIPEDSSQCEACNFCGLSFAVKDQVYDHANDVHPELVSQAWKPCPDCRKYFPTKRIVDLHREKSTSCIPKFEEVEVDPPSFLSVEFEDDEDGQDVELPEEQFLETNVPGSNTCDRSYVTCTFCNLVLSRRQDLYDHANRDHLEEVSAIWHSCHVCVRYYPTKRSLNNHLEKTHRKGVEPVTEPKGETCNFCSSFFSRRELYYRHVNKDHLDVISQTWNACVECFKYFPTKRVLSRHREKFRARGESCIPRYAHSNGSEFSQIFYFKFQ